jgi:MmyB-like transcription regulator ligand binding domain/Cell cycle protein
MSALRKPWASFDGPLLISVLAIIGMGLVNLYSATRVAPKGLFSTQLMFFGIGTVLFLLAAAVDYRVLQRLASPIYLTVLAMLVGVLLFGKVVNGSRRWFGFANFGIQPSELMKLALIVAYARLFSAYVLQLAGLSAAAAPEPRDAVPPSLMHLVDSLKDIPAALINRRWDILAWNKTAGALFGLNSLPPEDLNSMICMFDNPHLRSLLGEDWATIARTQLANFRRSSGPLLATPWFTQLVARLLKNSPEFRDWWPLQEVSACPVGMPINATLQSQRLQLALEIFVHNEGKLILGIYNPKNQETAEELRKLK